MFMLKNYSYIIYLLKVQADSQIINNDYNNNIINVYYVNI